MTIHATPVYGISYADVDTPLLDIAQATQQAAETTEAALLRGGVVPPAAADLNAVTARVVALEGKTATAPPYASNWTDFLPDHAPLRVWTIGKTGFASGIPKNVAAVAAGANQTVATMAAGFRPGLKLITTTFTNDGRAVRLDVQPDGQLVIVGSPALSANTYLTINMHWPLP